MGDAGFFKGANHEQDARFGDKKKKLLRTMKFPAIFNSNVDISKVKVETLKPWITKKVTEMIGIEDDLVVGFVFQMLEEKELDPREMQINLTGFLESNAPKFMEQLWKLLLSAQEQVSGIPKQFLDEKMAELKREREAKEKLDKELQARRERERAERPTTTRQDDHDDDNRGSHHDRRRSRSPQSRRSRDYGRNRYEEESRDYHLDRREERRNRDSQDYRSSRRRDDYSKNDNSGDYGDTRRRR